MCSERGFLYFFDFGYDVLLICNIFLNLKGSAEWDQIRQINVTEIRSIGRCLSIRESTGIYR